MKNRERNRILLMFNQSVASIRTGSAGVARLMVFSALIIIASCNGSPPANSIPYCDGEPCLKASLEKGEVDYRVLLIGDAGAPFKKNDKNPAQASVLKALEYFAGFIPDRTAIVFLGDNIYKKGLPDESVPSSALDEDCQGRACAEKRIDAQINAVKGSGARGIFVPGNHDWHSSGGKGWKRIRNLDKYIADAGKNMQVNIDLVPDNGCPGPVTVPLSGNELEISLMALDTQWWLHDFKKPAREDNPSHCDQVTETEVIESIKKRIEESTNLKRPILLASHHPLKSYGQHGGYYSSGDLIRPLYLIEQIFRKSIFAGRQELHNAVYKNMRVKIESALQTYSGKVKTPMIYAAGHDHSLQIIDDQKGILHLVSGAGSAWKATRVGKGEGTLFSHTNKKSGGFIAVDYLQSGEVRLAVVEPRVNGEECKLNGGKACVVFSRWAKGLPN